MDALPHSPYPTGDLALAEDTAACERPLFEVFAEVAARQPDHLAVDDGDACLTYAELRDRALALAPRIAAQVPADGLVAVLLPTSVQTPVAWLACLAARRAFLPLDPLLPPARTRTIIAEAGLAAAIVPTVTSDLAAALPATLLRITLEAGPGLEHPPLPSGLPASAVGMVLFTSGSTGRPKGIALHERSQLRKALTFRRFCDIGADDRLLSLNPLSAGAGASDTFGVLLCGASLHLADLKRDGLGRVLSLLRRGGMTVCAAVPVVERALVAIDEAAEAFSSLRILRLNSDSVTSSDVAALAPGLAPTARILLRFGSTESGTTIAQRLVDPHAPVEPGRLAVGPLVPGQTVSVEDAHGNPVRPGEIGELVVRGRYVALGYWVNGRLDPTAFPTAPCDPGIRCYRSGDRVTLRSDGMLVLVGRADRQLKINGVRVEPGDTEAALRGLPGIVDAAVLVHGDADAPALVAFVVPAPGENMAGNAAQLVRGWRAALAAVLPQQQVPARILAVPAIPLLPNLKPDHAALCALLLAAEAPSGPGRGHAHAIARAWGWLRGGGLWRSAARISSATRRDGAVQ